MRVMIPAPVSVPCLMGMRGKLLSELTPNFAQTRPPGLGADLRSEPSGDVAAAVVGAEQDDERDDAADDAHVLAFWAACWVALAAVRGAGGDPDRRRRPRRRRRSATARPVAVSQPKKADPHLMPPWASCSGRRPHCGSVCALGSCRGRALVATLVASRCGSVLGTHNSSWEPGSWSSPSPSWRRTRPGPVKWAKDGPTDNAYLRALSLRVTGSAAVTPCATYRGAAGSSPPVRSI